MSVLTRPIADALASAARADLATALKKAGFEPPHNVCAVCHHPGGEHDLGNWCLTCPRPEYVSSDGHHQFRDRIAAGWDYFSSMTDDEKWAYGVARLLGPVKP